MSAIYDNNGNELADIPLSENQVAKLDLGVAIAVQYHTPQLLRSALGNQTGVFMLWKKDGRIRTDKPDTLKRYAELQKNIAAAREGA